MQVLLAYGFDRAPEASEVAERLDRVAAHYRPLWRAPVARHGVAAGRTGLHLWDAVSSPWRWPSWQQAPDLAAATLYLPLGYERLVGRIAPERAALPLARALIDRPAGVLELTAPFVVASLAPDTGRLRLHTDGIGLGRLYELRFPGGWVWSNRPAAACRFAGIRARPDRDGWRMFAATGWFQGDRTPFTGVFTVPGGATVGYDPQGQGRTQSVIDALAAWAVGRGGDALAPDRVDEVADGLRELARSLGSMWSGRVLIGLSGGRDSRLCVAAALAAGLDLQLFTNGSEPGEAEVAEGLVAALPDDLARRVRHRVARPRPGGPAQAQGLALDAPILPNALGWHRSHEGLRAETYLPSPAPAGLDHPDFLTVSGAAGEIAHGFYYPPDYAELSQLPHVDRLDAFAERLCARILLKRGLSDAARAASTAEIRHRLDEAFRKGLDDARMLDHFYATERLRRWSSAADRIGTIVPLLAPEFVRAAFDLTPDQRRENALHRAVTARLLPQWRDRPYYQRPAGLVSPALAPRLGDAPDRDLITALVADRAGWADAFTPSVVNRAWARLLAGAGRPADERLLQRVIWRAVFADYLAEVNDEPPVHRTPRTPAPAPPPRQPAPQVTDPSSAGPTVRGRRFVARGLRRVARALDPAPSAR
ncbi:hypothetical protein ACIBPB_28925 [Micromonospora sp. NPDC049836]|uniref:hypothetical protein n=1 Tax=Micromonospora sp. NPDC049836 TaxID=3364274 RepID=UPI00378AA766